MNVLTPDLVAATFPTIPRALVDAYVPAIIAEGAKYGISTPRRLAAFLAEVVEETGLTTLEEDLNYSAPTLWKDFRSHFKNFAEAADYAHQPERIANRVYANRMGNGDEASGDGWRNRGRGLIQLTGEDNYEEFADATKRPNDDALRSYCLTPDGAVESACWYWSSNRINVLADKGDITEISIRINGGTINLARRIANYDALVAALSAPVDHSKMRLGRAPKKLDPRHFGFASYLPPALPIIPASADWGSKVADWGMMLNDEQGDCTCAAVGHAILAFTTANGAPFRPADADVEATYVRVTGAEGAAFDPATGANDDGAAITDVLSDWRKNGMAGHFLGAYAGVQFAPNVGLNVDHLRLGIAMFGAVDLGVNLPTSAQSQDVWDVPAGTALTGDWEPGSWGGHSIVAVAYDAAADTFVVVTWGARKTVTKAWLLAYCDEAEVLFSPDWTSGAKPAPSGFDMALLRADLAAL